MYHPYFRGKQFELKAIREAAPLLAKHNFVPVIEPVKKDLGPIKRTLDEVSKAKGKAVLIVNPFVGELSNDGSSVENLLDAHLDDWPGISVGIHLSAEMTVAETVRFYESLDREPEEITLVHAGLTDATQLSSSLGDAAQAMRHVFVDRKCGRRYRDLFQSERMVLLRDGFNRCNNADYGASEMFSDLHTTYRAEGVTGFGDFLTQGDYFPKGGGLPYAVAIHLTYFDPKQHDNMYVAHFISDSNLTQADPAGKFAEAVAKLSREVEKSGSLILRTDGVEKFLECHREQRNPGLGYAKKLSLFHHMETFALGLPKMADG